MGIVKIIITIIITIVLILYTLCLVNGKIETLNKNDLMDYMKKNCIPYKVFKQKELYKHIKNFKYPLIFKPCECSGFGNSVNVIRNIDQAKKYIKNCKHCGDILVQKIHYGPFEGTIQYIYNPITNYVKIIVVERVNPNSTKGELWLWKSSKSYNYGYFTRRRRDLETEELKIKIHSICQKIPHFHLGRFDIRFENENKFKLGKDLNIVELNLSFSSDTRYSEKNTILFNIYIYINWFLQRIYIGICALLNGNILNPVDFVKIINNNIKFLTVCMTKNTYKNIKNKLLRSFLKIDIK